MNKVRNVTNCPPSHQGRGPTEAQLTPALKRPLIPTHTPLPRRQLDSCAASIPSFTGSHKTAETAAGLRTGAQGRKARLPFQGRYGHIHGSRMSWATALAIEERGCYTPLAGLHTGRSSWWCDPRGDLCWNLLLNSPHRIVSPIIVIIYLSWLELRAIWRRKGSFHQIYKASESSLFLMKTSAVLW